MINEEALRFYRMLVIPYCISYPTEFDSVQSQADSCIILLNDRTALKCDEICFESTLRFIQNYDQRAK